MEDDVLLNSSISNISDINQLDGADSISSNQSVSDNNLNGDDSSQNGNDSSRIGDDSSHNGDDISQNGDDSSHNSDDSSQYGDDSSQYCDDNSESGVTEYDWDEEAFSAPIRAVLVPAPALPGAPAGAPPDLTVDTTGLVNPPSCLPLAIVTNARSLKMKMENEELC